MSTRVASQSASWYIVVTVDSHYRGASVYVRRTSSRGTGPYFQLVRSYRQSGKVRQEVLVHLGEHPTPESALATWPVNIEHLRSIGRDTQAKRLEAKLHRLCALVQREEQGDG
jgi:hypothetical protein